MVGKPLFVGIQAGTKPVNYARNCGAQSGCGRPSPADIRSTDIPRWLHRGADEFAMVSLRLIANVNATE
jgi:hypothetical protein